MSARLTLASLLGVLVVATWTAAQYAVNRQLTGLSSPSLRHNVGVPPWQQTHLLPSEARMMTRAGGELPSTLRMNALAVGPLAPEGNIAYVVPRPVGQAPRNVTHGNFIPSGAPPAFAPRPSVPPPATSPLVSGMGGGSIRYTSSVIGREPGNLAVPSLDPASATPDSPAGFQPSVLPWASGGSVTYSQ